MHKPSDSLFIFGMMEVGIAIGVGLYAASRSPVIWAGAFIALMVTGTTQVITACLLDSVGA